MKNKKIMVLYNTKRNGAEPSIKPSYNKVLNRTFTAEPSNLAN
jgi:hypothetical protein